MFGVVVGESEGFCKSGHTFAYRPCETVSTGKSCHGKWDITIIAFHDCC